MNKCKHFALGVVAGRPVICSMAMLAKLVESQANIYHVGLGIPLPAKAGILDEFKRYKYCPKCGEKLDFERVWQEIETGVPVKEQKKGQLALFGEEK